MGLYRMTPPPSARMGALWTLGGVKGLGVVEYGAMGHMLYQSVVFGRLGAALRADIASTHIDEQDIATGRTRRLEQGVESLISRSRPGAVVLLPSIIPAVIGVDLDAVRDELQSPSSPSLPRRLPPMPIEGWNRRCSFWQNTFPAPMTSLFP